MFDAQSSHVCSLTSQRSEILFPSLGFNAPKWARLKRYLQKLILVSKRNPATEMKFPTPFSLNMEKHSQLDAKTWIIHPCSDFRLFYEMWMTAVLLGCLVFFPLDSDFAKFVWENLWIINILVTFCIVDIVINFRTGYFNADGETEMNPCEIAKKYIFSPFFICDVLSSLPQSKYPALHYYTRIAHYLSLLKIVRLPQFLKYLGRTVRYFGFRAFYVQLGSSIVLVTHYCACLMCFLAVVFDYSLVNQHDKEADYFSLYIEDFYASSSLLLAVERGEHYDEAWYYYALYTVLVLFGKIMLAFVTVMLVKKYEIHSTIEMKFHAMFSEVNAFLKASDFSDKIQDKIRQVYRYKFRGQYLNQKRVERYISEQLKKEVMLTSWQMIIEHVPFFRNIPRRLVEDITSHLEEEIFLPADIIIRSGGIGDYIYFLKFGTVAVTSPSGKEICHLQDGDYFGEISLIWKNQKQIANVVALEICDTFKLQKKYFAKFLAENPALYQHVEAEALRRSRETKEVEALYIRTAPTGIASATND